ncbi:Plasmid stabilization system protein ParE [Pasteurella testudinis DSM 23072]|uniref:Plasmid stabilization system protein ParE n=1 Tax=Pasteurella testudinis DSM 23072 TaxID=1122938 RepID=A0A1W1UQD9_9PAST|nr:type II toxin-antitoxin system RelE/ParE family toxin [Pasteurella testudinis]SMB82914.1 Plasmid stabilization system protein ParE [Pasteurella testudinis DSM 23072]SUB51528.1 Plasmid stabilisation system protein [Pasteurella testudinis]
MALKVYWTDFAKNELKQIILYYKSHADTQIAKNIARKITDSAKKLGDFPQLGSLEPLLSRHSDGKEKNFRYIISTNYKIIYFINSSKNQIEIIDIFATKQNPEKLARYTFT